MPSPFSTRRQFLRQLGGGAGSLALASSWPHFLIPRRKEKLGVALVGLGSYSRSMLGPALKETSRAYLAGVVTGDPSGKGRRWAAEYGFPKKNIYDYDGFDAIADNPDIDIVYIVLPNSLHAPYTIRALAAGKHVICEKPLALTAAEGREMVAAARRAGKQLATGYRLHYDPFHQDMMRLGQEKVFGEVTLIEASLCYRYEHGADSWKMQQVMGGGPLLNLGVYPIQGVRYTKGAEPIRVQARAHTQNSAYVEVPETVHWEMEFADGSLAHCSASAAGYIDRLYAAATGGYFELTPSFNYTGQAGRSSQGPIVYEHVFQQVLQIDDFARCVQENLPSRVPGEEGLRDLLVLDAIQASIKKGQAVEVTAL
ncbi:MAG: gfo/Idh/MocA family oxidoreductase [Bacteroidetes bacterium]|nr:MAG: gfo/Idh/MocA family oxidoreductase [Bacteroidota bacterium]